MKQAVLKTLPTVQIRLDQENPRIKQYIEYSKFAASKKKSGKSLLGKARFPTFVVRRRNRPAGEGN